MDFSHFILEHRVKYTQKSIRLLLLSLWISRKVSQDHLLSWDELSAVTSKLNSVNTDTVLTISIALRQIALGWLNARDNLCQICESSTRTHQHLGNEKRCQHYLKLSCHNVVVQFKSDSIWIFILIWKTDLILPFELIWKIRFDYIKFNLKHCKPISGKLLL